MSVYEPEPITHFQHPTECSWCGTSPRSYFARYAFCDHVLCGDCATKHAQHCNWRRTDDKSDAKEMREP